MTPPPIIHHHPTGSPATFHFLILSFLNSIENSKNIQILISRSGSNLVPGPHRARAVLVGAERFRLGDGSLTFSFNFQHHPRHVIISVPSHLDIIFRTLLSPYEYYVISSLIIRVHHQTLITIERTVSNLKHNNIIRRSVHYRRVKLAHQNKYYKRPRRSIGAH